MYIELDIDIENGAMSAIAVELMQRYLLQWRAKMNNNLGDRGEVKITNVQWETEGGNHVDTETMLAEAQLILDCYGAEIVEQWRENKLPPPLLNDR